MSSARTEPDTGTPPPADGPAGAGGSSELFGEFCAAGLWPGLGRALAGRLTAAGIRTPEDVTAGRLELVEGVGPKRAERLAGTFEDALPAWDVAEVLASCRVPVKFAGPAVGYLGKSASIRLREDPWLLLTLPQIQPNQADWFARQLLSGQADPQDPRRGRAIVTHLLGKAARDGHTAVPAEVIMRSVGRFRIEDPAAAVTAAIDDGTVIPFTEEPPESEDGSLGGDGTGEVDPGDGAEPAGVTLLALARYAMAEEAVAEGLQRLAMTAEPLPVDTGVPGGEEDTSEEVGEAAPGGLFSPAPPEPAAGAWEDDEYPADEYPDEDYPDEVYPDENFSGPIATGEGGADEVAAADPQDAPGDAGEADGEPPGPAVPVIELDEAQRGAVEAVTGYGVTVLAGGPGTGKSRTVAAVVALAAERGLRVALAAPTGRAAKRLEELAGAPATTLHRLLGAQGRSSRSEGGDGQPERGGEASWTFSRNEEWPLDADLVVVDESSMLDAELAAALVEACADGTRLLLVGDPAQLPSIGPGRVLADIIDSGAIPVTELTTLYRQREGGVIARLATAVRGGELPPVRGDGPGQEHEAVVVPVRSSAEAARRVAQLVTDSIPRALGIPPGGIQVVTPVHKGAAGTIELNRVLKAKLNPGPGAYSGFDPGDRVVATANHIDEGFANGEVGVVSGVDGDGLVITFTGVPVTVPFRLLSDLRHGWAMTVHRAQGSEWPAVITVFPAEATTMLSRPLVYTALTRAQRHLSVVHGAGPALARAVQVVGERPRQTRLASLLR